MSSTFFGPRLKSDIVNPIVAAGYRRMANSGVCICALARHCAPALVRNLPFVDTLCARFGRADVVIVENDSKDNSKNILRKWAAERPHIRLLLDDFGPEPGSDGNAARTNPSFSRARIER